MHQIRDIELFKWTSLYKVFYIVGFLWLVYWVQIRFDFDFAQFGIYPRTWFGSIGIVFSPFVHEDLNHLSQNSVPLFLFLLATMYFYRVLFYRIVIQNLLLTGLITWVIGRESFHIGASGLVYGLASFLFFKGFFSKNFSHGALSLMVVLWYGGMMWYVFPGIDPKMSWESHLSGFIAGFVNSLVIDSGKIYRYKIYDWEMPDYDPKADAFMQSFDENGRFVGKREEELWTCTYPEWKVRFVYEVVSDVGKRKYLLKRDLREG